MAEMVYRMKNGNCNSNAQLTAARVDENHFVVFQNFKGKKSATVNILDERKSFQMISQRSLSVYGFESLPLIF